MTITVTPQPLNAPPRSLIQVAVPAGGIMQSVAIYRTDGGVRALIRQQPTAGFDSRSAFDYEAPFGVPLTYDWTTTYVDPSQIPQVWTEAWANLTAWTTVGASWSVSGGKLVWTGSDSLSASVSRTLTPGLYRFLFAAPVVGVRTIDFGGFTIDVANSRLSSGNQSVAFLPGTGTWKIDMTTTAITITTTAGVYSIQAATSASKVSILGPVASPSAESHFAIPNGSSAGQTGFGGMTGIAVDPTSGNLIIADWANSRVNVFTSAGVYVQSFGSAGSGDGQFNNGSSMAIAIDSARNVFVGNNNRVQKFAWSGSAYVFSAKVGASGAGNGQFNGVNGIAVDAAGLVYVSDQSNNRVQRFSNVLVYSTQFGTVGATNGKFQSPQGIAVDSAGNIAVADLTRVQIFTSALAYSRTLPSGNGDGQILNPYFGVAAQGTTFYIVSQTPTLTGSVPFPSQVWCKIQKFDAAGNYYGKIDRVGPNGQAGQNDLALAVTTAGKIFLTDASGGFLVHSWTQTKASVDDITTYSYGATVTIAESAPTFTLAVDDAWLIHPANPGLSIPIHYDDVDATTFETVGDVSQASTATVHQILGQSRPIAVSTGPRAADNLSVTVMTETSQEEAALRGLLADQVPILVRTPPAWGLGFQDGFYAVGDVGIARQVEQYDQPSRGFDLPMQAVDSPIVLQVDSGWSWAAVAAEFATWDAVYAAFASWADLLINNRRAGF